MRALVLISIAAGLFGSACDQPTVPTASANWPDGTVLAIDEHPIGVAEVDAASAWIEHIEPNAAGPQLRRLALIHVILPRALAREIAPAPREDALQRAKDAWGAIQAGEPLPAGLAAEQMRGTWSDLGIPVWGAALELEDGAWSGVLEGPGEFFLVRRRVVHPAPAPVAIEAEVELCRFPFLPLETGVADIERAYDEHRLTIVDPAWREIVPERIQYRMGVHSR